MDFGEALRLMKQGRKMKRSVMDPPDDYIGLHIGDEDGDENECFFYSGWYGKIELNTDDILADDWEVYDEPD